MGQKKLHIQNIKKSFNGRTVVEIEDMEIGTHAIEGLIGPNGAGKTTLMSLITRKLDPDHGRVLYYPNGNEVDISTFSLEEIARNGIVRTNQVIQDFNSLSIKDSMLLSLANSEHEGFYKLFTEKKLRSETEEAINEYLDYFHFENVQGHALSGGEKKLLDIIRCLLLKPKFLLMDEPTAGLPDDLTRKVMELMKKKTAEEGMSILIVEHDLDLIWEVCERVHFMAEGQIMLQGTPEEIRKNRTVAVKYMGEDHA